MSEKKVILVTGGANGIGKTIVSHLARNNAHVVFCDKDERMGSDTEKELRSKDLSVEFYPLDLRFLPQINPLVDDLIKRHGRLDGLVNNARAGKRTSLKGETSENWDETFDVILKGPFFLSQRVADEMGKQKRGALINIGSVAGTHIGAESPSYHMAKAALIQMTRYFARYAGPNGIRSNCILPGFIIKEEHLPRYLSEDNSLFRSLAEISQPCGYTGRAMDVANAASWLLSEEKSRFMNGSILYLDGGLTTQDPYDVAYRVSQ